ncbi:group IID secretory phospholipase A2 [Cricetulus griseus]|uniref:Phospholipase A2 n=2 Tax=Cricetulus griseus TaxID=10029 RepID=A0A8C2LXP3_CRIGR|nr:group IID secretory phospholipase A2 [Cricetulus griseus]XP_027255610.1 group IID secretory phospholipase A2 [Cricetulus griseus]
MRLALLCGLLMLAGRTPTQGGLLNLNKMVRRMTGKIAFLNYWPYGCHCGLGGKGTPKDATDWCCHKHDCCYAHLKTDGCRIMTDNYKYSISQGVIQCSDKGSWCERELCACDKEVALCLKQNLDSYNKRLRYYWRSRCTGHIPTC